MDTVTLEKFHQTIKEEKNLSIARSIQNMLNDLPEYLAIRIEDKYKGNCYPFKKIWRYSNRDSVFEGAEINNNYFKMDIWCSLDGYDVHFWEPNNSEYNIIQELKDKVKSLDNFKVHGKGNFNVKQHFNFNEEEKLFKFIDSFLVELKTLKEAIKK